MRPVMGFSIMFHEYEQEQPKVELDIIPQNFSELFDELNRIFPDHDFHKEIKNYQYLVFNNGKLASLTNDIQPKDIIMVMNPHMGG